MFRLLQQPLVLLTLRPTMPTVLLPVDITLTSSSRMKVLMSFTAPHRRLRNHVL